ncbi:MAG TPA: hypothetical protein VE931_07750 [Pyrinomonadaceae bacterium]|nr:hypothetical protein [Pyrinomonadaceae bacterium]
MKAHSYRTGPGLNWAESQERKSSDTSYALTHLVGIGEDLYELQY